MFPNFKVKDLRNNNNNGGVITYDTDSSLVIPESGSLVRVASVDESNSLLAVRKNQEPLYQNEGQIRAQTMKTATIGLPMTTFRPIQPETMVIKGLSSNIKVANNV